MTKVEGPLGKPRRTPNVRDTKIRQVKNTPPKAMSGGARKMSNKKQKLEKKKRRGEESG